MAQRTYRAHGPALALATGALVIASIASVGAAEAKPGLTQPTLITRADRVAAACTTTVFNVGHPNEPSVASDPGDPQRLWAAWSQDRGNYGSARSEIWTSGDAGRSWSQVAISSARSVCDGGPATRAGSSDDWISVGADGAVYHAVLSSDPAEATAVQLLVEVSRDSGRTWTVTRVPSTVLPDKESILADPRHPGVAYVAWCDEGTGNAMPTVVARTDDWGRTWSAARPIPIGDGGQDHFPQLALLDDGTLVAAVAHFAFAPDSSFVPTAFTSTDGGEHWSDPVALGPLTPQAAGSDGNDSITAPNPIAVTSDGKRVIAVWSQLTGTIRDAATIRTAVFPSGGGWKAGPSYDSVGAVLPAAAINRDGRVGVTWLDFASDAASNDGIMTATVTGVVLGSGHPAALTRPFDVHGAAQRPPNAIGAFLGDYAQLAPTRHGFVAVYGLAGSYAVNGRTDMYAIPLGLPSDD